MSRTKSITLAEFKLLVEQAQRTHEAKNEPIPTIKDGQLDQIDSSLKTPFQTFAGRDLYRGFLDKASILFYLINKNHGLGNGNKRMACLTLGYFFYKNGRDLKIPKSKFYALAKRVTNSNPADKDGAISYIKKTLRPYV